MATIIQWFIEAIVAVFAKEAVGEIIRHKDDVKIEDAIQTAKTTKSTEALEDALSDTP